MVQGVAQGREQVVTLIQAAIHTQEEEQQGPTGQEEEPHQEEHPHQEEAIQAAIQAATHLQGAHPRTHLKKGNFHRGKWGPLRIWSWMS